MMSMPLSYQLEIAMYKCKQCDNVFDEPTLYQMSSIKIDNGSDDWIEDEYVYVCPDCYSINIFEISEQEK